MFIATVTCPGCGAETEALSLEAPARYRASGECWARYGELAAYNIRRAETTFVTQLAVDAYGAQHAGPPSKLLTTAFSLIGLYLAVERGYEGRQVQRAHIQLARQIAQAGWVWPSFSAGGQRTILTVLDVLATPLGAARDAQIRAWAATVWASWPEQHQWAADFCRANLV